MQRLKIEYLATIIVVMCGCSHGRYSAATLPNQYVASSHVSARHLDFSRIPRDAIPTEWLQPGDEVFVTIATGVEKGEPPHWTLTVADDGSLNVPLIGYTPVMGITPSEAADRIRQDSIRRNVYIDPKVTVSIEQKRTFQVSVVGAVNKPNTYELPASNCDLLSAITMADALADDAGRYVQIRHSPATLQNLANSPPTVAPNGVILTSSQTTRVPPAVVNIDLANVASLPAETLRLYDGSVVSVSREPKRLVSVIGLVRTPKQVEMPIGEDLDLLSAIAGAGGTTLSVADKVYVVRKVPDAPEPIVIEASLKDARTGGNSNFVLAAGDIVSVEETPMTILIQTIQTFFRVGFNAALPGQ